MDSRYESLKIGDKSVCKHKSKYLLWNNKLNSFQGDSGESRQELKTMGGGGNIKRTPVR